MTEAMIDLTLAARRRAKEAQEMVGKFPLPADLMYFYSGMWAISLLSSKAAVDMSIHLFKGLLAGVHHDH